jgi:hypothetical protein
MGRANDKKTGFAKGARNASLDEVVFKRLEFVPFTIVKLNNVALTILSK